MTCKNLAKTETYGTFKVKLLTSELWKCKDVSGSSWSLSAVEPWGGTSETKLILFLPCSQSKMTDSANVPCFKGCLHQEQ